MQQELLHARRDEDPGQEMEKLFKKREHYDTQKIERESLRRKVDEDAANVVPKDLCEWMKQDRDFHLPPRLRENIAAQSAAGGGIGTPSRPERLPGDYGPQRMKGYLEERLEFALPSKRSEAL